MEASKLIRTHWPFKACLGLLCASLFSTTLMLHSAPSSLCMQLPVFLHCGPLTSLAALIARSFQYLHSTWSFVLHRQDKDLTIDSRSLFLLINLLIFFILTSLHLQQRFCTAGRPAKRRKRGSTRMRKLQQAYCNSSHDLLQQASASLAQIVPDGGDDEAACTLQPGKGGLIVTQIASTDFVSEKTPLLLGEISPTEESKTPVRAGTFMDNFPHTQVTVDAVKNMDVSAHSPDASTVDRIVLEEDGRLRLIETADGSDASRFENGRERLIDRPVSTAGQKPGRGNRESCALCARESRYNYMPNLTCNSDSETHSHSHYADNYLPSSTASPCLVDDIHSFSTTDVDSAASLQDHNVPDSHSLIAVTELSANEHQKLRNSRSSLPRAKVKSMDATHELSNPSCEMPSRNCRQIRRGPANGMKRASRAKHQLPSMLGQDELNARVESFIAKFNEKIKIQRQQSLVSYLQMVDRGA